MKTKLYLVTMVSIVSFLLSSCAAGTKGTASISGTGSGNPQSTNKAEVIISGFTFQPATLTVKVGTEVTWTNKDSASHSVVSTSGNELNSPLIAQNANWSHVFMTAGTYPYKCGVHPTMMGTIIVTP
jgi:plastocyanin